MDNGGLHGMNGYQGGGGYNMEAAQPNGNGRLEEAEGEAPKYSDINLILDQILSMSDQSVDEAQVKSRPLEKDSQTDSLFCRWSRQGSRPSTATG